MVSAEAGARRGRTARGAATRDRLLAAAIVAIVAWGVLAFGAVYPWAYWPLAAASCLVGVLAYSRAPGVEAVPATLRPILLALVLVLAGALLQTVPLPAGLRAGISPGTDPFLRETDLAYAAAATLETQDESWARTAPRRPLSIDPAATMRAVALLAGFTVLLLGLTRHFERRSPRALVPPLIALGVFVACIGIVQKAVLGDDPFGGMKIYGFWTPQHKLTTPFGPFVNKNHYAGWMLMAIPLTVGYVMGLAGSGFAHVRPRWRDRLLWLSSPEGGRLQLAAGAVVLMGAALALTKSRSGLACFVLALAAAAVSAARAQRSTRARLAVAGGLAVLVAGSILLANVDLATRFTSGRESVELRRQAWRDAISIVRDFPLTGTGLNTYGRATLVYDTAPTDLHFQEAHNDYLQLIAEGGLLLGVPALVAALAGVRAVRRRLAADRQDPIAYWLRFGAATGIGAMALQSTVEFSLQMPGNAVLFVLLCAVAVHRTPDAARPRGDAGPPRHGSPE
jgi:hypothetical protein